MRGTKWLETGVGKDIGERIKGKRGRLEGDG